jgi:hypothetical protein
MTGAFAGQPLVLGDVLVGDALQRLLDLLTAGGGPVDQLLVDPGYLHHRAGPGVTSRGTVASPSSSHTSVVIVRV